MMVATQMWSKKVHADLLAKHRGVDYMEEQSLCSYKASHTTFHFVCLSERVFSLLCLHILFLCIF